MELFFQLNNSLLKVLKTKEIYGPDLPIYFRHIVTNCKGAKIYYNVLMTKDSQSTSKEKWTFQII